MRENLKSTLFGDFSFIAARYPLQIRWSDEDAAYLGSIPNLTGDCCHADSPEGVLVQLKEIAEDLVEHLMSQGADLPQPAIIGRGSETRSASPSRRDDEN